ncbi:MAG: hypothetical protein ABGY72_06015 [bacterium]
MRTTIDIPEELLRRVKSAAALRGASAQRLLDEEELSRATDPR